MRAVAYCSILHYAAGTEQASGLDTVSQCSGTESMSDWRRILRTEDFKFVAFLGILRAAPQVPTHLPPGSDDPTFE